MKASMLLIKNIVSQESHPRDHRIQHHIVDRCDWELESLLSPTQKTPPEEAHQCVHGTPYVRGPFGNLSYDTH